MSFAAVMTVIALVTVLGCVAYFLYCAVFRVSFFSWCV